MMCRTYIANIMSSHLGARYLGTSVLQDAQGNRIREAHPSETTSKLREQNQVQMFV